MTDLSPEDLAFLLLWAEEGLTVDCAPAKDWERLEGIRERIEDA